MWLELLLPLDDAAAATWRRPAPARRKAAPAPLLAPIPVGVGRARNDQPWALASASIALVPVVARPRLAACGVTLAKPAPRMAEAGARDEAARDLSIWVR